ncbi:MAG: dTDP-4-dehydrorhamnose 3,5-epimerase [Planctomycetes bacterium]|nr:dTDP-4-dehydrorhamnose 3,5-epimerase [Planctomycetota bacterium]
MKVIDTDLPGVLLIEPKVHGDTRGFFLETYHQARYQEHGISGTFVQDNHSKSSRGILRGLHTQLRDHAQGKLLRVVSGAIFDVAVDIRVGSPTFGEHYAVELSSENHRQLWVPPHFAHGFCVLSDTAEVEYKCTRHYAVEAELAIRWNDPAIGIAWPITDPKLSAKDQAAPTLQEAMDQLPSY